MCARVGVDVAAGLGSDVFMRLFASALLLMTVACSSSSNTTPVQASRASCGPTPPEPLTAEKCFGEFLREKVQTTSPHAPNYVPPGCPCADLVYGPTPDGGWVAVEDGGAIEH